MNEHLQMLATQAGIDTHNGELVASEYQLIRFAELIVLECERVAKDPHWYSENASCGWKNPIKHVCYVFNRHFGVSNE